MNVLFKKKFCFSTVLTFISTALILCCFASVDAFAADRTKGYGTYSTDSVYTDIDRRAWYITDGWVPYVTDNNLMQGYSGTKRFGPDENITRAQVATVLYRSVYPDATDTIKPGDFAKKNTTGFGDVEKQRYYTAAVNWAKSSKIITGYTGGALRGKFAPYNNITREELAAMIERFVAYKGQPTKNAPSSALKTLPDYKKVSSWAKNSFAYCTTNKIITGVNNKYAEPQGLATRAQMAKIMSMVNNGILKNTNVTWNREWKRTWKANIVETVDYYYCNVYTCDFRAATAKQVDWHRQEFSVCYAACGSIQGLFGWDLTREEIDEKWDIIDYYALHPTEAGYFPILGGAADSWVAQTDWLTKDYYKDWQFEIKGTTWTPVNPQGKKCPGGNSSVPHKTSIDKGKYVYDRNMQVGGYWS